MDHIGSLPLLLTAPQALDNCLDFLFQMLVSVDK